MSVQGMLTTVMGMLTVPTQWGTSTVPVMRDMKAVALKTIALVS